MKEKKGRDLTIEEMFAVFIGEVNPNIAEKHFNFFRKAFEESELGGENFDWDALYSKYFDNMKRFAINDISKLISNTTKVPAKPVTPAEVNKQDAETNSNIQEDATPVGYNQDNTPVRYIGRKTVIASNKIPFLGIKYKEVYNEATDTIVYVTDESLAEHIVMNTGGTLFEVQDYQAKIAELRSEDKNKEADTLEKKSFLNLALKALETNTINEFEKSLKRVVNNSSLPEETRKNAALTIPKLKKLRDIRNKHAGKFNFAELVELEINNLMYEETLKNINNKLQELSKKATFETERHRLIYGIEEESHNLTDLANMLRIVVSVSKQYQNQGLTLPDLINEGNLGLIKATQRLDETRGFKFISFAVWWIRQSILQALAEQSRIVRLPLNKIGSINKTKVSKQI